MKKIWIPLLFITLITGGCSAPSSEAQPESAEATLSTQADQPSEEESRAQASSEQEAEIPAETCLELVSAEDYAPVYQLTLKKIEGGTGNELNFETTELLVNPADSVGALTMADPVGSPSLSFSFWNLYGEEEITFAIDGLEYTFSVPKTEPEEVEVNQAIRCGDEEAVIQSVSLYPKAAALHFADISDEKLFENFIFLNVKDEEYPPYDFCDEADGRTLLFVFDEEITAEEIQGISIGEGENREMTVLEIKQNQPDQLESIKNDQNS